MNWLKYRKTYFIISFLAICLSIFSLVTWGLKLSVDFRGGSIVEYKFVNDISTEDATQKLEEQGIEVNSVQSTGENSYLFRLQSLSPAEKAKLASVAATLVSLSDSSASDSAEIVGSSPSALLADIDSFEELRFETVGPSIGPELVKKTIYAIVIAASAILLWVAYQFKSFKFGASAILAMFHDSFILVGVFSLLGHFRGIEVDFLFVTALLTTLSFSVHDTIVVFDRIREIGRADSDLKEVGNKALTETMVRSLNNSFTIIFMLLALLLLGGTTVKLFAGTLLIGTILGTYSSPFVAVPLLVTWDDLFSKVKGIRGKIKLTNK